MQWVPWVPGGSWSGSAACAVGWTGSGELWEPSSRLGLWCLSQTRAWSYWDFASSLYFLVSALESSGLLGPLQMFLAALPGSHSLSFSVLGAFDPCTGFTGLINLISAVSSC